MKNIILPYTPVRYWHSYNPDYAPLAREIATYAAELAVQERTEDSMRLAAVAVADYVMCKLAKQGALSKEPGDSTGSQVREVELIGDEFHVSLHDCDTSIAFTLAVFYDSSTGKFWAGETYASQASAEAHGFDSADWSEIWSQGVYSLDQI